MSKYKNAEGVDRGKASRIALASAYVGGVEAFTEVWTHGKGWPGKRVKARWPALAQTDIVNLVKHWGLPPARRARQPQGELPFTPEVIDAIARRMLELAQ